MHQHETLPPILTLPNEMLSETFSYLLAPIAVLPKTELGYFAPIVLVRHVCRRFRAVANDLKFWADDDFVVDTLTSFDLPPHNVTTIIFRQLIVDVGKRICGLSDYGSRTDWHHDFMQKFGLCSRLRNLQLVAMHGLNFDYIPKYCPSLEVLSIDNSVVTVWADCHGTLEGLSKLRQLSLHNPDTASYMTWNTGILPSGSVASLTVLKVEGLHLSVAECCKPNLETFINLKSLHLGVLSPAVCNRIINADFKLTSFAATLVANQTILPCQKLTEMMTARCLRGVEKFR
jgi:hypothetical protein